MPSSTGSSGSPTGSTTNLGKCVFKKICLWEDANISAAVLTAGNLFVLFLLNENPIAWIQFAVIFGVLPLGLAARVFGFDSQLRQRIAGLSGGVLINHGKRDQLTPSDLIRVSVSMIVAARMISVFGSALTIGIVGNLVMLVPLLWSYIDTKQIRGTIETAKKTSQEVAEKIADTMYGIQEMLLPVAAGLLTFITIVGVGKIFDTIFVILLGLIGYGLLLGVAVAPKSVMSGNVVAAIGSSIMPKAYEPELKKMGSIVNSVVFWESFTHSVATSLGLYGVYVISAFTGLSFVVASVGGLTVTFASSPSAVREKFEAKLTTMLAEIEAKISTVFTKEEIKPSTTSESDENVVLVNAQEKS